MDFLKQVYNGLNDFWRYLLGIILIILGYFFGQVPLLATIYYKLSNDVISNADINKYFKTNNFEILKMSSNTGFLLLLLMFVFTAVGLKIGLSIHKKTPLDVITVRRPFDFKRFFWAFWVWFLFGIISEFVLYFFNPDNYVFHFSGSSFIVLLLICVLFLPIQTAMEEIIFRGYLAQMFYLLTKHPWVSFLITTILFSLIHSTNPEIDEFGFWPMQVYYIGAGLFLCFLAYLDNGLEIPIGVHTATNFYGAAIVKYQGAVLQTDTLFSMKTTNAWIMSLGFFLAAALFLILASKKFNWFNQSV